MENENDLTLEDLVTDPPENAEICWRCNGYRKIVAWDGMAISDDDCPNCDCNGWVLPAGNE